VISDDITVPRLLDEHPDLVEVLADYHPHFKRLRNRLLRKVMPSRITVSRAAGIVGVPADELLAVLNRAVHGGGERGERSPRGQSADPSQATRISEPAQVSNLMLTENLRLDRPVRKTRRRRESRHRERRDAATRCCNGWSASWSSLRDPSRLGGLCGRCEYRERCGGSRARGFTLMGDPLGEDPGCSWQPPLLADTRGIAGAPTLDPLPPSSRRSEERLRIVIIDQDEGLSGRQGVEGLEDSGMTMAGRYLAHVEHRHRLRVTTA
jgi:hypothetical protein